jgi:hypothetical protein
MATKKNEQPSARCDACDAHDEKNIPVELVLIDNMQVTRCQDPVACRMRAQQLGIWSTV